MTTKLGVTPLGALCDAVIEAGWLVALIVVPLVFNVHASNAFELDKVTALRGLALVMALAWLIKGLDAWLAGSGVGHDAGASASAWRWLATNRWVWLGLAWLAAEAAATATSVAPRFSLWGSHGRVQGLYTTGAYVVVFLSLLGLLRRREQVERLISAGLVASLPVSLYGILQHFGTDPVPWATDVTQRVASTLGNPIFTAAFLITVVPFALHRYLEAGRSATADERAGTKAVLVVGSLLNLVLQVAAWWTGPRAGSLVALITMGVWGAESWLLGKPPLPFIRIGGYGVLLSAQLAGLLLTQSRGPWVGLAGGLLLFALLWTVARGRWTWAWLVTALGAATVVTVVLVNVPNSPLAFVREWPYVGRLSRLLESTGRVRLLIWEGVEQLVITAPSRAVTGYGPETMRVVLPPYLSAQLGPLNQRGLLADRAHNETLDVLTTTGAVGLVAYLLLFTSLFTRGLGSLGLARSWTQRRQFLALWLLGGVGAVLLARLLDGSWRLVGAALPLGMLGGLFGYLFALAVRGKRKGERPSVEPTSLREHRLVAACLAAIAAHVVEIQFGIAITATRTYFWAIAALLVVTNPSHAGDSGAPDRSPGRTPDAVEAGEGPATADQGGRVARRMGRAPRVGASRPLVVASLLVTVILVTVLYDFLAPVVDESRLPGILWLVAFTWVFGGVISLAESWAVPGAARRGRARALGDCSVYAGITLGGCLLFASVHLGLLRLVTEATVVATFHVVVLSALLTAGSALLLAERCPDRGLARLVGPATPVLAVAVLAVAAHVGAVRADIYYRQGWVSLHREGNHDRAVARARQALELAPAQDVYHGFLGQALAQEAQRTRRREDRDALFRQAEESLSRARALSPLDPDRPANLARLYGTWARASPRSPERTTRFRNALAWYAQATALSPNNVLLWNERAATYQATGDHGRALETYARSLALDDSFAPTYLQIGDLHQARGDWERAAKAYERAIVHDARSLEGYRALGAVYARMGRVADAMRASFRVLAVLPNDVASHRSLAWLYRATGRFDLALAHARRALAVAPPHERKPLEQLVEELRQTRTRPAR